MSDAASIYWEGCAAQEIRFLRCGECGRIPSYPRPFCERCGSHRLVWHVSSGRGRVEARTVVYRAPNAKFEPLVPYVLLLVRMAEGFIIMAHGELDVAVNDEVRPRFVEHDGRFLPVFALSSPPPPAP